jgi:hypothetical protein
MVVMKGLGHYLQLHCLSQKGDLVFDWSEFHVYTDQLYAFKKLWTELKNNLQNSQVHVTGNTGSGDERHAEHVQDTLNVKFGTVQWVVTRVG